MKITTVRYRRLQSHDRGYGHDAVEVEAQVDEGETAEEVMTGLKKWVHSQLDHLKKTQDLCELLERLQDRAKVEERGLERLKREVEANLEVIRQHEKLHELAVANGLAVEAAALDPIPF